MRVQAICVLLVSVGAFVAAQDLTTNIKPPITIPYDSSLRPETTYLVFDQYGVDNGYGPIDPRVANNVTGNQPEQIHLSIAGPSAYWVMWATGQAKVGQMRLTPNNPNSVATVVQYGYTADNLNMTVTGFAEVYDQIYNNFDPNKLGVGSAPNATNYTSPIMHSAQIQNLKGNTRYYYRVGDGVTFSAIFNFTAVNPKGPYYPQRLLLVGDWGMSLNSTTTLYHLQRSLQLSPSATALLNTGDLSYADDAQTTGAYAQLNGVWQYNGNEGFTSRSYQPIWDAWARLIQPLVAYVPHLPVIGNHDIEQQDVLSKYLVSYSTRFKNSYLASGSRSFQYYSVDIGPSHNIFLSAYADYTVGSDQWNWLLNDLISIDRTLTPWVTVSEHHPLMSTDTSYKEFDQMRQQMEPLFYQYGVDIFYNGHVHSYERINPVYNYNNDKCGIVHITIGDGGNQEGLSGLNYQSSTNGQDPLLHLYEDTLSGCPSRSTNTALNDPTRISSANPRAYRPTGMTPLDGNSNSGQPLNSSFDPWQYYALSPIYQGDGNTTGSGTLQRNANPPGYCYKEQPSWSAYRESSFGHGTLDILNSTHALWHWIRNQDDETGVLAVVTDPIYVYRDPTCTNKQGVKQPAPPASPSPSPSPSPAPTTAPPATTAAPAAKDGILGALHQTFFGFQAQDGQGAADSPDALYNTYNPADQGQDTHQDRPVR